MRSETPRSVEIALTEAERNGFRLAVIGRTCALVAISVFYGVGAPYPSNVYIAGLILASVALGLAVLGSAASRYERLGRYVFFAFDAAAISAALAFAPLSSGGDVPQNLVFFSSRTEYYYVVVAVSVLALSPALVLWTGICAVAGLAGATAWIIAGMDRIVSYRDLPTGPSREEYLAVVLNPDFLGIAFRVNEGVVLALVTCIAALAVHRARNMVRAHAAAEANKSRIQQIFGRYVPALVAEQLIDAGQLAPQQREASIMFADIEGFTRFIRILAASTSNRAAQQLLWRGDGDRRRGRRGGREPCRRCIDRGLQRLLTELKYHAPDAPQPDSQ